ncbi:hypothetical protein TNCV_3548971 [Trichonephila clavipes]|nr:hypothetical protein TNCV_3548971 [Trichonephila clavipes]
MGHEDELTTEELQEILNEEHLETQRNVSPKQEEDERGPMLISVIKDLLKKGVDETDFNRHYKDFPTQEYYALSWTRLRKFCFHGKFGPKL